MEDIDTKRKKEITMVREMIYLYCKKKHKHRIDGRIVICESCNELMDYASLRSEKCPHMKTKTFCANCTTSCYKPEMKERIREVMRFSGPRMIVVHPIMVVSHVICSVKEKRGKVS